VFAIVNHRKGISMKSSQKYTKLLTAIYSDGYGRLGMEVDDLSLDFVKAGYYQFGLEFLTLALPELEKTLLVSLDVRRLPEAWPRVEDGSPFLGNLLQPLIGGDHPVNPEDQKHAAACLQTIRQFLSCFGKMKVLPTQERTNDAVRSWFDVEEALRDRRAAISEAADPAFVMFSKRLLGPLFTFVEKSLASGDIPWRHGPGAVAEQGVKGVRKFSLLFPSWTARADKVSNRWSSTLVSYSEYEDRNHDDSQELVSPSNEQPMFVTLVPKTAKAPRIIAMEPTIIQWGQQALMVLFTRGLRVRTLYRAFDWTDQTRNQNLAREGSITGQLATLDLSEASDRLHLLVVARLLPLPLRRWVFAFRSTRARFEDGTVHRLQKFAPMGSAMCFVMESLVFYCIASYAIYIASGKGTHGAQPWLRHVSVYGDDIIVPTEHVAAVIDKLEAFGLKVNLNKSHWSGYFRESCGKDYLHGYDVTVVRARYPLDNSTHADATMSLVSAQNEFYKRGWFQTARVLRSFLSHVPAHDRILPGGYSCLSDDVGEVRWNPRLYRLEYKVARPVFKEFVGDGWDAMRGWLAQSERSNERNDRVRHMDSVHAPKHLVSRPKPVGLRFIWSPDQQDVVEDYVG
jgi:hypothetical protein